ncbi:MAG: type II secretion system F family protein [Planctomycetota bacterium]|jgi:general secretion pathway protein F/type IV pilus assembly protein PilC
MPDFSYVARNHSGEKVSGSISADGRREALAALAGQALFPIDVQADSPVVEDHRVRRVPAQLLATTYGQMSDLLQSGVPLLRSLEVLQKQTSHAGLTHVLGQMHRQIEDGATMAEAMGRFEHIFGEMAVSMIRSGGEGGFLEEAFSRVAEFTEAAEDLKKRTIGAMVYPLFLAAVGVIVVTVLIVFFVPKFEGLFEQLRERGELPALTRGLLWVSARLGNWGLDGWTAIRLVILIAAVVGGWYGKRWLSTESGRLWWDRIRLKIPLVGPIFLSLAVARFCRVLGTLLRNGVPILRSLESSSEATANRVLAEAIQKASENISAGQPLAKPLGASGQFPPLVVEMIAVAEQANTLEKVLLQIADALERRTWRRLDLAVRLIEPILLLILAGVVLVVVVALLYPVLKMGTTI